MSILAQVVIAMALLVAGFVGGVKYHAGVTAQRDLAAQHQTDKERGIKLQRVDRAAVGLETDKAALRTEFLTITKEVDRVVEKPVYRNQCFDDDGLRLIATAIAGSSTTSEPAPAVPGPATAD